MPAARGVKRSASKASTSAAVAEPKNKKKRGAIQLEIPTAPKRKGCVYVCGMGDVGQLGLGEDVMETTKFKHVTALLNNIVDVIAGGMHTLALDSEGKVWSWGCNDEGALGRATTSDTEEGTPGKVSLPSPAVALSAGDSHSAALLNDGQVWAWGSFRDSHGSMGLVAQGREGRPCKEPAPLPLPPAAAVASGGDHLVVLDLSGNVYTMGCGEQGQLGRLTQRSASRGTRQGLSALLVPSKVTIKGGGVGAVTAVWAGSHATFAASAGKVLAWGLNNYGQLAITGEKRKTALYSPTECDALPAVEWRSISAGQHHTLALTADGKLYAIGRCEYGRLGLGDREGDAETPELIPKLQNKKVVSISTGTSNSFAVTDTGEVFGWGMGSEGQLGTGNSNDANEPAPAALALGDRVPARVAAGGQHTVLLAEDPNAPADPSPEPEKEEEEEKMEAEEERVEAKVETKVEAKRPRANKRQKKQEQDEEISSTSSAPAAEPEKVNGDKKKETAMEVDETDSGKPDEKEDNATDKPTDAQPEPEKPEKEADSDKDMDTSSQDTTSDKADVEMKPEVNGDDKPEKDTPEPETKAEADTKAEIPEKQETKAETADKEEKKAEAISSEPALASTA